MLTQTAKVQKGEFTFSISHKRPESVLVVIYTVGGHTLLLKRIRPVFWQSVTGSLEWPAEKPADAARREDYEETGIEATDGWLDWNISRFFPILREHRDCFAPDMYFNHEHMFSLELIEVCPVTLASSEHDDSEWCSFHGAKKRIWSWTNRIALNQVSRRWSETRAAVE